MPYRVKDTTTGHEYTVAVVVDGQTELDKPAVDRNGDWLPAKYQNSVLHPKAGKAAQATTKAKEATA